MEIGLWALCTDIKPPPFSSSSFPSQCGGGRGPVDGGAVRQPAQGRDEAGRGLVQRGAYQGRGRGLFKRNTTNMILQSISGEKKIKVKTVKEYELSNLGENESFK